MCIVLSTSNLAACRQGRRKKMTYKCIPSSKPDSTPSTAAKNTRNCLFDHFHPISNICYASNLWIWTSFFWSWTAYRQILYRILLSRHREKPNWKGKPFRKCSPEYTVQCTLKAKVENWTKDEKCAISVLRPLSKEHFLICSWKPCAQIKLIWMEQNFYWVNYQFIANGLTLNFSCDVIKLSLDAIVSRTSCFSVCRL